MGKMKRLRAELLFFCVNFFIILHVYLIVVWSLPGSAFRTNLLVPVNQYGLFLGLWQSWDMFAPQPLRLNMDIDAELIRVDGQIEKWTLERPESVFSHWRYERVRKYKSNIRLDTYSKLWPDFANFIKSQMRQETNAEFKGIRIMRRWSTIEAPPPGDYQPILDHYPLLQTFVFYSEPKE